MKQQNFHSSITANISAREAFERIGQVSDWWTVGVRGDSRKLGDAFTVRFGETFVDFEIVEVVPDKRIVWLVTDCNLPWIKNKKEWKDTRIEWNVSTNHAVTQIDMTHVGLFPGVECYDKCEAGWNFYVGESLRKLLAEGEGLADGRRSTSFKA